ncbi:substrate-binding domain-containing protein [Hoeflea sp. AS60]|uniref:substrate-binding domain-containing protein n=1 Tax=Hoeflea sp. AS60 TaxID=3135780 RepID=UPI003176371C
MSPDAREEKPRGRGAALLAAPQSANRWLFPAMFLCGLLFMTACTSKASLVISGASTLYPVIGEIGEIFEAQNPEIRVDVMGGGTGRGINAVLKGRADIAMVARDLTEDELRQLDVEWIAQDAIAIVTHEETLVEWDITIQGLHDLYGSEFFGPMRRIRKQASHGTAAAFAKKLGLPMSQVHAELEAGSNAEVLAIVARTPGTIGYVSSIDAERAVQAGEPVRILQVDGVLPTLENVRGGVYPIRRRLGLARAKNWSDLRGHLRGLQFLEFVTTAPESKPLFLRHGFASD